MTSQKLKKALKKEDKTDALNILNPLIEIASKMLLAGTLKRNVVKFFTNRGIGIEAATNLIELAEVRAENLSHYKFK